MKTTVKHHLQIESQRRAMDNYDTYYLMSVHTMPDGEVIYNDVLKETDLVKIREIAKQQARSQGCFVVEEL